MRYLIIIGAIIIFSLFFNIQLKAYQYSFIKNRDTNRQISSPTKSKHKKHWRRKHKKRKKSIKSNIAQINKTLKPTIQVNFNMYNAVESNLSDTEHIAKMPTTMYIE